MSVYSNEIDLEVLQQLVAAHANTLPREVLYELLKATQAWQRNEPQSDAYLCRLIAENSDLDRAYGKALADLRRGYLSQERTKSVLIPNQPFSARETWANTLIPQLETLLLQSNLPRPISQTSVSKLGDNFDRIAIMGAGGAFLGSALAQLFGGGMLHLIGAIIGAIVGIAWGVSVSRSSQPSRRRS